LRLRSNLILLVIATAVPLVVLAILASYLLVARPHGCGFRCAERPALNPLSLSPSTYRG